jgi:hypothetical protein
MQVLSICDIQLTMLLVVLLASVKFRAVLLGDTGGEQIWCVVLPDVTIILLNFTLLEGQNPRYD